MSRSKGATTAGLAVTLVLWAVAPVARAADDELPEQTVRYIGVRTGVGQSGDRAILYIQPMKGGPRTEVIMRSTGRMKDYFLKLAPGQPITVGLNKIDGKLYLASVSALPPEPGEAESDTAYIKGIEVRKINSKPTTVLVLTKFDQTSLVEVPRIRTKEGMVASPALLKTIKALKIGTLVEVEVDKPKYSSRRRKKLPVLKSITAWAPWRAGEYSKLGRKKIGKLTYVSVEIKSSGIPLVLLVPKIGPSGRTSNDRTMLKLIYKLKRGQAVEFKIRQEGLSQFIRKIRPSAARPAPRR